MQKEELVPLYVRRSLEGYPGITPLSGLASGYEAIARHLPAGSPVLLFALQRLAQRAQAILRKPGGLLQPGLDLVSLLAHLMLLIDYNVSPALMPELFHGCSAQHFAVSLLTSLHVSHSLETCFVPDGAGGTIQLFCSLSSMSATRMSRMTQGLCLLTLLKGICRDILKHCMFVQALEDGLLLLEEVVKASEQHIALQACSSIVEILSGSDDYTRKVTLVRWYMRLADMVTRGKAGTLG